MYGRIYVRCLDRYNPKFLMLISFVIVPIAAYMEIQHQGLSISTELAQMGNGADSWVGGLNGLALGRCYLQIYPGSLAGLGATSIELSFYGYYD